MKERTIHLKVWIQPGASQNKVINFDNGILKLRIAAPPVEGKANKKLVEFLSEILHIAKRNIAIKAGLTGKHKIINIDNLSLDDLKRKLESLVGG